MSPRSWTLVAVVLAAVVLANLIARDQDQPHGPRSSSYATSPEGVAAYASLLDRLGYNVSRQRTPVDEERPDPRRTVVMLEPRRLTVQEGAALAQFVEDGGRLVTGGAGTSDLVRALGADVHGGADAEKELHVTVPVPASAGVRKVESAGERAYRTAGSGLPLLVAANRSLGAVQVRHGRGVALLLADVSPLQNRLLAQADNARLAVGLTGPSSRAVTFVENVHGYDRPGGLAALPARWKAFLILAAVAGLLFMLLRARRFGDPEPPARELDPPRREYVEAVAATLLRTRDREAPVATLRAAARYELARRTALTPEGDVREAALSLGLTEEEAAALDGDADLIVTGRALARLSNPEESG